MTFKVDIHRIIYSIIIYFKCRYKVDCIFNKNSLKGTITTNTIHMRSKYIYIYIFIFMCKYIEK